MARTFTPYRRTEVEEFDRKLRRFSESLAHRERRMLREIIESALTDDDDAAGYAAMTDDQIFALLARLLAGDDETDAA
ncbi:MAG: hypothetical protein ACRDJE_04970 [Dehalococcoidia bacterium]